MIQKAIVFNAIILLFLSAVCLQAQTRGGDFEAVVGPNVTIGKQWAVFIAIDRYSDRGWDYLSNPVKDAREIQTILRENYIIDNWEELFDEKASATGIRQLFERMRTQVGRDDSVFIFHAGHGFKDNATDSGAWIPSDAGKDRYRKEGWISHDEIRRYLDRLPARHVLLVSDSCYSGDLLAVSRTSANPQFDSDYYRKAYSFVSRQVMTSGASEEVPDLSDFARRLKTALNWSDGASIDAQRIWMQVRETQGTTARLGIMPNSSHQTDASFIFFKKQNIITDGRLYRFNIGTYSVPREAVDNFEILQRAGFTPAYEKIGDNYQIVITDIPSGMVTSVINRLETLGFTGFTYFIE